MRKFAKTYVEVDANVITCDFCGYEILESKNTGCCGAKPIMVCSVCGRHFCKNCGSAIWDEWDGDYPSSYRCKPCNFVFADYAVRIDDIREKYYRELEDIENEWKELARKRSKEACLTQ